MSRWFTIKSEPQTLREKQSHWMLPTFSHFSLMATKTMLLQETKRSRGRDLLLCCFLLWTSGGVSGGVNLRRFVGCAVREFTFLAKKPGCKAMHITTDACWGRCETWEKPVVDPPYVESHQNVCTYNHSRLITVKLNDCQSDVDPSYTYPVALRCHCGVCVTRTTECLTLV